MFCLGFNLILAVWLVQRNREAGLGLANTLSAGCNSLLLLYALRKKLSVLGLAGFKRTLLILVPNAIVAGAIAFAVRWFWEHKVGHANLISKLGAEYQNVYRKHQSRNT